MLVDPSTGQPYAASGGSGSATTDREFVVTTYRVKTAFTGASVGDTVTATQVLDVSGTPSTVTTIWRNQTTAADLASVPSAANLELVGSQALTDAQLRASPIKTIDGLSIPQHDYVGLTYTGVNLTGVVYKTGGSGGSTVATVALGYDGSNNLTSVTKS